MLMETVYVVQHTHERDNGDLPDTKWLGVFATEQKAQAAIATYRTEEGFRDYPDGFEIEPFVLNQGYWAGGYETIGDDDFEIPLGNRRS